MKKIVIILAIVILTGLGQAGPVNQKQIAASAKWAFHLDLEQLRASEIGKLASDEAVKQGHAEKLDNLAEVIGYHPYYDVNSVLLYGPDDNEFNAVMLIAGNLNDEKIVPLIKLNETYKLIEYGDLRVHQWIGKKDEKPVFCCFSSENHMVVTRKLETIQGALDVLSGTADNLTVGDSLARLDEIPKNTIVVVAADDLQEVAGDKNKAAILNYTEMLAVIVGETQGNLRLNISLITESAESAQQTRQMIQGIVAFMMLKQRDHPELLKLASAIKIAGEDKNVEIDFEYPSWKLFELLEKIKAHKAIKIELKNSQEEEPAESEDGEIEE